MKVDRSKFLIVVGALSAATGVAIASTSCSSSSSSTKNDAGASGVDSGTDDDSGGGQVNDDAGNNACLGDLPDAGAPGDAGDAGDGGDVTGCAALTGSGCALACDDIATKFRSAVADDIRKCLMPAPTCEGTTAVTTCVQAAAEKACPDPAATTTCTPLVANCGGADAGDAGDGGVVLDQATCEKVVRPLNQAGRDTFTSCITEGISGQCTLDVGFCIQQAQAE